MTKSYNKSDIISRLVSYIHSNNCKNLYKDSSLNYKGETKDTKENYSKVIVDYLVKHIEDFKNGMSNITVTRNKGKSYKTKGHDGESFFDFDKHPKGERREEKIAHAMYCQYKDKPAAFGKILDYQIPLKNTNADKDLGKIDLLSAREGTKLGSKKVYFLELKKDDSKETLLRCILEAFTYSKTIDKKKLCKDFSLFYDNCEFVVAPLVYKFDGFEKQLEIVEPLINLLGIQVEIFTWEHNSNGYRIESLKK
ncbi:MAG: hypothetical protein J5747_06685 [Spirochaetaceae bacterium]|nr:hypothetical protein [Spirochaetaceae bacterium]